MSGFDYFMQRFISNLREDYYDVILVSSRGRGRVAGEGRPYRVGKSTFALWLSYLAHKKYYELRGEDKPREEIWDEVFSRLFHDVYDIRDYVRELSEEGVKVPAVVWDEAELTAPAYQHIPDKLRDALNEINTYGTQVVFLILTAPSMIYLAKPLRMEITFEIIVPRRGYFEIQFIDIRKNFRNPLNESMRYIYVGEGTFPPLPPPIRQRYDEWRRKLPSKVSRRDGSEEEKREEEPPEGYLPVKDAAKVLGLSTSTIRGYCADGKLDCVKVGGRLYVNTSSAATPRVY